MAIHKVVEASAAKTLEQRLTLIEDRLAIHNAIMRYCRGVDRGDAEMIHSAFHDDAIDNHNGTPLPYRDAVGSLKNPPAGPLVAHNICNEYVEIDGNVAQCETYFFMVCRIEHKSEELDWLVSGRYIDRFEQRDDTWRIAKRVTVYDWQRFDPIAPAPDGSVYAKFVEFAARGSRGPSDWYYQEFDRLTQENT